MTAGLCIPLAVKQEEVTQASRDQQTEFYSTFVVPMTDWKTDVMGFFTNNKTLDISRSLINPSQSTSPMDMFPCENQWIQL